MTAATPSPLWAELPDGRWQIRVSDDFWYQLDPSGDVILSPMGISQYTVSGDLDTRLLAVERIYREKMERKVKQAQHAEMDARAALAALRPKSVAA
jgi:hypothetical protein